MRILTIIILIIILVVSAVKGGGYLLKNCPKIFKHPTKSELEEKDLLGSEEINNFRIAQIQLALKRSGYEVGMVDGKLGKNTRRAIKEFQIVKGIPPTGRIDSKTYFELLENKEIENRRNENLLMHREHKDNLELKNFNRASMVDKHDTSEKQQERIVQYSPPKTEPGNFHTQHKDKKRETVKTVQVVLQKLRYYQGKIDGILGKKTRLAIKEFQRIHGLKPDGIVGIKTRLCLSKEG